MLIFVWNHLDIVLSIHSDHGKLKFLLSGNDILLEVRIPVSPTPMILCKRHTSCPTSFCDILTDSFFISLSNKYTSYKNTVLLEIFAISC